MDVLAVLHGIGTKMAAVIAAPYDSGFRCGECDRSQRCGLSPDEPCVFRAEQMERYEQRRALLPWRLNFLAGRSMTPHNDAD